MFGRMKVFIIYYDIIIFIKQSTLYNYANDNTLSFNLKLLKHCSLTLKLKAKF